MCIFTFSISLALSFPSLSLSWSLIWLSLHISVFFHLTLFSHLCLPFFCHSLHISVFSHLSQLCCCVVVLLCCCVVVLFGCLVAWLFLIVLHWKTLPCVRSKRSRVTKDTGVLKVAPSLLMSLSLSSHVSLSSHSSLFFSVSFHLSFFLFFLKNSFNNSDNDRSSSYLSARTALTCLELQSAWAVAHCLLGEHVRIMQETFLGIPVQASCHLW